MPPLVSVSHDGADDRAESPFERALVYPMVGTLCGAWVGVLPICLDWDRPWQVREEMACADNRAIP